MQCSIYAKKQIDGVATKSPMNINEYMQYFKSVSNAAHPVPPYDNSDYMTYSQLNWARQQRWLKHGKVNEDLVNIVRNIEGKQKWVLITEPWCGDAPHVLPFIWNLSVITESIELEIELRDSYPFSIEHYLSGNKRSIPKLVIRNDSNIDLFVWGPRPIECQRLHDTLKAEGIKHEHIHIALQHWYNHDRGVSMQLELLALYKNSSKQGNLCL